MENNGVNKELQDDSITLAKLIKILWNNIILIGSVTVLGTILTIVFVLAILKPSYSTKGSVVVNADRFQSNTISSDVAGGLRATGTIADWIIDDKIVSETIKNLVDDGVLKENEFSVAGFKNSVSITQDTTTLFIYVKFTYTKQRHETAEEAMEKAIDCLNGLLDTSLELSAHSTVVDNAYEIVSHSERAGYAAPNKKLYVIVGFLAFAVLGVAISLIKEMFRNKIKSIDDIEEKLHMQVIGIEHEDDITKMINIQNVERLITNIDFSRVDPTKNVIQFTSSIENEGKTSTIHFVAKTLAANNRKALIIDLDLRRPSLHKELKIEKGKGITDYCTNQATIDEVLVHSPDGFDYIQSGSMAPNPVIILHSEKLLKLIEEKKAEYDYIFIDCPPMSVASDAKLTSTIADAQIMLVAYNYSKASTYKLALKEFRSEDTNIIGAVITRLPVKASNYYYYHYYKYYKSYTDDYNKKDETKA